MAKIYIAAPWVDRERMPGIAEKLEGLGHEVTHKWWDVELGNLDDLDRNRECAQNDVMGVFRSDLLLLINSGMSEGKSVEQGIAIALGRPILAVGTPGEHGKNVFHFLQDYIWVEELDMVYQVLDGLDVRGRLIDVG